MFGIYNRNDYFMEFPRVIIDFDNMISNSRELDELFKAIFNRNEDFLDEMPNHGENDENNDSYDNNQKIANDTIEKKRGYKKETDEKSTICVDETPSSVKVPKSLFDLFGQNGWDRIPSSSSNNAIREKTNEMKSPTKDTFVFIANRMTFLTQTKHPIIYNTSKVTAIDNDCLFVPFDEKKTFPKISFSNAAKIANEINNDEEIQMEIKSHFGDDGKNNIYCSPIWHVIDGNRMLGFAFSVSRNND